MGKPRISRNRGNALQRSIVDIDLNSLVVRSLQIDHSGNELRQFVRGRGKRSRNEPVLAQWSCLQVVSGERTVGNPLKCCRECGQHSKSLRLGLGDRRSGRNGAFVDFEIDDQTQPAHEPRVIRQRSKYLMKIEALQGIWPCLRSCRRSLLRTIVESRQLREPGCLGAGIDQYIRSAGAAHLRQQARIGKRTFDPLTQRTAGIPAEHILRQIEARPQQRDGCGVHIRIGGEVNRAGWAEGRVQIGKCRPGKSPPIRHYDRRAFVGLDNRRFYLSANVRVRVPQERSPCCWIIGRYIRANRRGRTEKAGPQTGVGRIADDFGRHSTAGGFNGEADRARPQMVGPGDKIVEIRERQQFVWRRRRCVAAQPGRNKNRKQQLVPVGVNSTRQRDPDYDLPAHAGSCANARQ